MATAEHSTDFSIEVQADQLLSRLSRNISNLVLQVASSRTEHHTPSGTPLVTRGDIVGALVFLVDVLQELEQRENVPADKKAVFADMRQRIASLCVEPADAR